MNNIVSILNEGVATFSFKKADGSTRKARGTTNVDLMPANEQATIINNVGDSIQYWDLDKNAWRRFNQANLDQSSVSREGSASASA